VAGTTTVLCAAVAVVLGTASSALAHPGGLDSFGCHNDRKRGGYHCHRGPLAGQSFTSRGEAAAILNGEGAGAAAPRQAAPLLSPQTSGTVSCGTRPTCKRIPTCEMAYAYLHECGLAALDRDHDGVPCESGPC
jgi:hypothetical protein